MPRDRRMITPLFGSVHIVLADLRKNSPTQGRCVHRTSSWSQGESLLVPPGVAIGYLATSRHAIVSESSTSFDPPHAGAGVRWDAPGIRECFPPDIVPIVHARDQLLPTIESYLTREERDGDGQ
jgi:dTDP-4-dehydrorhamnose 3,5-epimerase